MQLDELLLLSKQEIQKKNFLNAKKYLLKAIKLDKNSFDLFNKLALVNNNLGFFKDAIYYLNKAVLINSKSSSTLCNLANLYLKIGEKKLALKNYLKAIEIEPNNFKVLYNLGNYYFYNNDFDNSEKYLKESINQNPNNIYPYNNLFQLYDRTNNLKELDQILEKAKKIFTNNNLIIFFEGILNYKKKKYKTVIKIFENLEIGKENLPHKIMKENILAKSYDNLKQFDKSFACFEISNKITEEFFKDRVNKQKYLNIIKDKLNFFSANKLKIKPTRFIDDGFKDPVFLVGFPRSGTTLLDTILSAHKNVQVLEEKPLVDKVLNELELNFKNDFSKTLDLDIELAKKLRKIYFKQRQEFIKNKENCLFIDKLPLNIINLFEINRIFPDSRFIFSLRHPKDAVLSCFMQPFTPNDAMSNFYNLHDASILYDLIMQLFKLYTKLISFNLYVIKYENLVVDFDKSVKSLVDFLGIDWDQNLKNFYNLSNNKKIITTPSYDQVNVPLYDNSIERWKNYSQKFTTVNKILDKWVKNFNY